MSVVCFFRVLNCDSQLFIGKSKFLEKKAHFFGSKTVDQHSGAIKKTRFLLKFAANLLKFLAFFRFFAAKTLKITISTSVWRAQHPNAGRNIQHATIVVRTECV